jgi:hypothetical protein
VQAQWLRLGGTLAGGRDDASTVGATLLEVLEAPVVGEVVGVEGATAASVTGTPPRQYIA